jgi:hypothetical protein
MPVWLKALLAVAGVFIVGSIALSIIGWVFHSLLIIAIGAAGVGVLWYGYHRVVNSLPAYKRRQQIRNRRDY